MEEIYVNVNSLMKSVQPAPEERYPGESVQPAPEERSPGEPVQPARDVNDCFVCSVLISSPLRHQEL